MPVPTSGDFLLFPSEFINIVSGSFTKGPAGTTQSFPVTANTIGTYLASEVNDPADCPRLARTLFDAGPAVWYPPVGVYELQCFPKHIIKLAGTDVDFISPEFPLGARFYNLFLFIYGRIDTGSINGYVSNFKFKYKNEVVSSDDFSPNFFHINRIADNFTGYQPFPNPGPFYSPNSLRGGIMGTQITIIPTTGTTYLDFAIYQLFLGGNYQSNWMSLTLNTPNANPGDRISISDTLLQLNKFTKFKAKWKANRNATEFFGDVELPIISHTSSEVILYLPVDEGIPYGDRIIYIFGEGDESQNFFGDFEVGRINSTPILTDGSGIYNLTSGKRNDTYYDRSVSPILTTDRKIIDPFIRTGFTSG